MNHETLSQGQWSLLGSDDTSLDHKPVVGDDTILDESSHRGDRLGGQISLSLTTVGISGLTDSVNLLVELTSVEVSILTGTGNGGTDTGRMPRSNTSDLSKTSVGLSWKSGDTPSCDDTFITSTLGDTNDIDILVLGEDGINSDLLLEKGLGEVNLGGGVSTVNLNLKDMSLLNSQVKLLDLGVCDDSDNGAELLNSVQLVLNIRSGILLGVLSESLSLTLVEVLVESSLTLFGQMLGEDGGKGTETSWGLNVSNNTNDNHRWGLNNGDGVNDFLLVHKGTRSVNTSDDVSHTGLESHEGGQVTSLGGIISWEGTNSTSVVLGTLSRVELEGSVSWGFKFSVGHLE